MYVGRIAKGGSEEDMSLLGQIKEVFTTKKSEVVFVLTPVNRELIYAYSEFSQAEAVYGQLKKANGRALRYLNRIDAPVINLFDAVPAVCFADLTHTNACGDEIIARSLAAYLDKEQ